jgi:transcriptional regulator with XRE-family HTH domain
MTLKEWIKKSGTTAAEVAKKVGVESWTINRYTAGKRLPEPVLLVKLYKLTRGAVTPNDFYRLPKLRSKAAVQ